MTPVDRTTDIPALPKQGGLTNVLGIRRLALIETRYVAGVVDPRTQPRNFTSWALPVDGLQLLENAVFVDLEFRAGLGTYSERSLTTIQGVAYGQSINVVLPRDHPQTQLMLMRLCGRKWLALCKDANGNGRLIGTPQQPMRFESVFGTNPNSHTLTGSTLLPLRALAFDEWQLFDEGGDFSFAFSSEFDI